MLHSFILPHRKHNNQKRISRQKHHQENLKEKYNMLSINNFWNGTHMDLMFLKIALAREANVDYLNSAEMLDNYTLDHSEGIWTEEELENVDILSVFLIHNAANNGFIPNKYLLRLAERIENIRYLSKKEIPHHLAIEFHQLYCALYLTYMDGDDLNFIQIDNTLKTL